LTQLVQIRDPQTRKGITIRIQNHNTLENLTCNHHYYSEIFSLFVVFPASSSHKIRVFALAVILI